MTNLSISLDRISGTVTWMIVSGFSLWIMWSSGNFSNTRLVVMAILCVVYILLWSYVTRYDDAENTLWKGKISAGILFFVIIAIYFATPVTFIAILMVIFSAITPYFMSIKRAFIISPLLGLPLFLVYDLYWELPGMIVTSFPWSW